MISGRRPGRAAGIARHVGDDDHVLVARVAADQSFEHGLLAVPHAVRHVLRVRPNSRCGNGRSSRGTALAPSRPRSTGHRAGIPAAPRAARRASADRTGRSASARRRRACRARRPRPGRAARPSAAAAFGPRGAFLSTTRRPRANRDLETPRRMAAANQRPHRPPSPMSEPRSQPVSAINLRKKRRVKVMSVVEHSA